MKQILPLILSFFFLLFSSRDIFAHDLTVECDRSLCNVSSKEAIFSPGVYWNPGMSDVKEIVIKNVEGGKKGVYFDLKNSKTTGTLDPFIHIAVHIDDESVWMGSLADLIEVDRVLLDEIALGSESVMRITARMDEDSENIVQGSSSTFDFGFGFEGEQNDSFGSESGLGSQVVSDGATNESISSVIRSLFAGGATTGSVEEVSDVTAVEKVRGARGVLGSRLPSTICNEVYTWVVPLFLQAALGILLFLSRFSRYRFSKFLLLQGVIGVVSAVIVYFLSCYLWATAFSVGIFLLFVLAASLQNIFPQIHRFKSFLT